MKLTRLFAFITISTGLLTACGGDDDSSGTQTTQRGKLVLQVSADEILSNGVDEAVFTAMFTPDGETTATDITGKVDIRETSSNTLVKNGRFSTGMEGNYKFYASYGPNVSNFVEIKAMPEIPEIPADPDATNTKFAHRHLLIDHTGTECPNCPYMMSALEEVAADAEYGSQFHLVASHSYNRTDPMYNPASEAVGRKYGNGYYPYVMMDLNKNLGVNNSMVAVNVQNLQKLLNNNKVDQAEVGISAAVSASPMQIIVHASVKAAATGNYRIGMWLLEDKIEASQAGATSAEHNIHNNALRAVVGSLTTLSGEPIGTIEAGKSAEIVRTINISNTWKIENCKVLLIVTPASESDKDELPTSINNCTVCPVGGTVAFDYK